MATVAEHDERHLARVYAWTLGGADEAIAAGREETLALGPPRTRGDLVVDLGADSRRDPEEARNGRVRIVAAKER